MVAKADIASVDRPRSEKSRILFLTHRLEIAGIRETRRCRIDPDQQPDPLPKLLFRTKDQCALNLWFSRSSWARL